MATAMQAGDAVPYVLKTQPVSLREVFPETPGFKVPPLDPDLAGTIAIGPGAALTSGYADVFRGTWVPPGKSEREMIAIKIFRPRGSAMSEEAEETQREEIIKRLAREVAIWQTLNSKHIVPLYGYTLTAPLATYEDRPCTISPWRPKGNLRRYIAENPLADRMQLLIQAAQAVNVLHTAVPVPIVHLNIKPVSGRIIPQDRAKKVDLIVVIAQGNFLVNEDNEIELCDFGISRSLNGTSSAFTTKGSTMPSFAPLEYLVDPTRYSTALDVYSFGFLILTILSDRIPFEGLTSAAVILKLTRGERPQRTEYQLSLDSRAVGKIWTLMDSCWSSREEIRPTMAMVVQKLDQFYNLTRNKSSESAGDNSAVQVEEEPEQSKPTED